MEDSFEQKAVENRTLLRNAIKGKCKKIPAERLEKIISTINLNRRYFIQVTDDPLKFQNIVTGESVVLNGRRILSETTPIYGQFTPGMFWNMEGNKNMLTGSIDPHVPAAAVKRRLDNQLFATVSATYTLVIYEPA